MQKTEATLTGGKIEFLCLNPKEPNPKWPDDYEFYTETFSLEDEHGIARQLNRGWLIYELGSMYRKGSSTITFTRVKPQKSVSIKVSEIEEIVHGWYQAAQPSTKSNGVDISALIARLLTHLLGADAYNKFLEEKEK
jgi:hypothetical protein